MATARSTASTKIALNLDTVQRDPAEVKDPFVVTLGGKRLVFTDAADLDWEVLAQMDSPQDFVEQCLSEADQAHLYEAKLPGWKFAELWKSYQAYYGLEQRGRG